MPPEHPSRVYARQLLPLRYGYPLYYPEPLDNLSLELRKRGINIGDVGHVTPEGRFHFAFNIFTPQANRAINRSGVPDGFREMPLSVDDDISCLRNKHAEKSELKTEGKYSNSGNLHLGANANDGSSTLPVDLTMAYNATKSSSESALLTMPHGAMGEDYDHIEDIRKYSIKNAPSWYTFINGTLARWAPNSSLYVVTGCDKSTTWGIATSAENSSSSDFSLTFAVKFVSASAGYSCSWSTTGITVHRNSTASNLGPGVMQPYNQCLFIRGFKIRAREGLFNTLMDPTVVPIIDHSNIDKLLRQGKSFPGSKGTESGSSGQGDASQPGGHGTSHQGGADDLIDDELDPFIGPYHALDTINKYLLETTPQAHVAISHESDWWDLSPGATLANEDEIARRLASHSTPSIESG
ncbi:hypothetical protein FIBSPDRAFT_977812 [Athelia psychrophila]|uniref:Uncharacterized protein n=1 Tax=Athelia psychrophila TaxID=1759441 RepID=A0A166E691_9AGAM|nr:hypothetical protein FIBSPDRAFT_977812 [Fibularhizoctonia sp. CBS 109695]